LLLVPVISHNPSVESAVKDIAISCNVAAIKPFVWLNAASVLLGEQLAVIVDTSKLSNTVHTAFAVGICASVEELEGAVVDKVFPLDFTLPVV